MSPDVLLWPLATLLATWDAQGPDRPTVLLTARGVTVSYQGVTRHRSPFLVIPYQSVTEATTVIRTSGTHQAGIVTPALLARAATLLAHVGWDDLVELTPGSCTVISVGHCSVRRRPLEGRVAAATLRGAVR